MQLTKPPKFASVEEAVRFFGIADRIKNGFFYNPHLFKQELIVDVKEEYYEPSRMYKIPKGIWIVERNINHVMNIRVHFCIYDWMIKKWYSTKFEPLADPLQLLGELKDYADGFALFSYNYVPNLDKPEFKKVVNFPDYAMDRDILIARVQALPVKKSQFNENEYYSNISWRRLCREILCFTSAKDEYLVCTIVLRNGTMIPAEYFGKHPYSIFKEV